MLDPGRGDLVGTAEKPGNGVAFGIGVAAMAAAATTVMPAVALATVVRKCLRSM